MYDWYYCIVKHPPDLPHISPDDTYSVHRVYKNDSITKMTKLPVTLEGFESIEDLRKVLRSLCDDIMQDPIPADSLTYPSVI